MAENRVIGAAGAIPWHLPGDFKFFKRITMGHVLVMGRRTYESIGRPLPGRVTIVLSRGGIPGAPPPGVTVLPSLEALLEAAGVDAGRRGGREECPGAGVAGGAAKGSAPVDFANSRVFIAGGAVLYAQALPFCRDLYLTRVHAAPQGDTFFPSFEADFDAGVEIEDCPEYTICHHLRL
ncbi:MAG: dihydrofolate reductase [Puniceicoccales bacterium]|jgi:dihydrofolate reductase|nr:dihydrofolate reductase [Puniceicoccales bacterium]